MISYCNSGQQAEILPWRTAAFICLRKLHAEARKSKRTRDDTGALHPESNTMDSVSLGASFAAGELAMIDELLAASQSKLDKLWLKSDAML